MDIADPAPFSNSRSPKDFAELINGAWRKGAEAFVEVGQYLVEAKAELDRDQYKSLMKELALSESTIKKLVCIGRNSLLSSHVNSLPPHLTTLYALSQIDRKTLETAIADGRIHPGMERKDAAALRKSKNDDVSEETGRSDNTGEAATETATRPTELLEYWQVATVEEQCGVLRHVGVAGLLELLKDDRELLAELYDRILGLQLTLAAPVIPSKPAKKLLVNLTGTFHWALGRDDAVSGAQGLKIIKAKLAANNRDPRDVCLAFVRKAKTDFSRNRAKVRAGSA
jgi:hypothetical protein